MLGCLWQILSLWVAYCIVEPHSFLGFLGTLALSVPVGLVLDWAFALAAAFIITLISRR